jgi:high-affinity iron transporter
MDAFLITFREGLEAALAVAVVIGFLDRAGRRDLRAWALAGIAAAVVGSVAGAVALSLAGVSLENPLAEGVTYLLATLLIGSLVVWMLRHRTDAVARIREGLAARAEGPGAGVAVAAFSFFLVGREGVETALFLGASAFGSQPVAQVVGSALGLAAAVALAVALARGIARVDLKWFFTVTAIALGVLAVKFLAGSALRFSEVGFIPSTEATRAALELVAEGPVGLVMTLGAVAAPVVVVAAGLLRRTPPTPTSPAHSH